MNAKAIVNQLTLEEKASLLEGNTKWESKPLNEYHLEGIRMCDATNGIRKPKDIRSLGSEGIKTTCYPSNSLIACSFDSKLLFEEGKKLGMEAKANHLDLLFAPTVNMKRSVLNGRNFEYYSEDPYVNGILGKALIEGIQTQNVAACVKSYFGNNQETFKNTVSSEIDERALFELYVKPFQIACEANPKALMLSSNKVNGKYVADSTYFIREVLRNRMDYRGLIISDFGGMIHKVKSLKAGCQLEMPSTNDVHAKEVVNAVEQGHLAIGCVDEACEKIVETMLYTRTAKGEEVEVNEQRHHEFAVQAAQESMVLLQNQGILPLSKASKILVLGELATQPHIQGNGMLELHPTRSRNLLEELHERQVMYTYHPVYSLHEQALSMDETHLKKLISEHDIVITCVGTQELDESEAYDRPTIELPMYQLELLYLSESPKNIVLVQSGSALTLPNVSQHGAIVYMGLAGQGAYEALVPLLYGEKDFSGKLAQSFPELLLDEPSQPYFAEDMLQSVYKESIYVGYRYYTTYDTKVLFPFGHGLQYADVKYHKFYVDKDVAIGGVNQGSLLLENTSMHDCKHVVQIYVSKIDSNRHRPRRELKAFKKVTLKARELQRVAFELPYEAFMIYEPQVGYVVEGGAYEIGVYTDANTCIYKQEVRVEGMQLEKQEPTIYHDKFDHEHYISDEEYQKINPTFERKVMKKFTMNNCLFDLQISNVPGVVFKVTERIVNQSLDKSLSASQRIIRKQEIYSMPLEQLYIQLNGKVKRKTFLWLLATVNAFFAGK